MKIIAMVRALFVGRFQPLHKGHVHAIRQVLKECDEVVIGIGSSNVTDCRNPLSAGVRAKMLASALRAEGVSKRWVIRKIPDFSDDEKWARYVMKAARPDVAYTNNPVVARCLRGFVPVKKLKMLKPRIFRGSAIRNRIRRGKEWEHLVPPHVARRLKGSKLAGMIRKR